jgi:hypothetical protein
MQSRITAERQHIRQRAAIASRKMQMVYISVRTTNWKANAQLEQQRRRTTNWKANVQQQRRWSRHEQNAEQQKIA